MSKIIRIGAHTFNETSFQIPYLYEEFPIEYDAMEFGYVINEDVPIYSGPDTTSEILSIYSNEVILLMHYMEYEDLNKSKWNTVIIDDGRIGYIKANDLHIVFHYRALFNYDEDMNKWLLSIILSGYDTNEE